MTIILKKYFFILFNFLDSKEKVIEPIEVSEKRQVWTCCTFTGNKYCCILSVLLIILCIIGIIILIFLFAGSKKEGESENELPEPEGKMIIKLDYMKGTR